MSSCENCLVIRLIIARGNPQVAEILVVSTWMDADELDDPSCVEMLGVRIDPTSASPEFSWRM
ncbi:unnamed protein product [Fusarium graminearum]|uniref:Uncharacterized protein n=1 Tax=Gibberella zeae TaxID=5518 RepID=A0A9N8WY70_GIBZA|nr:unnamed protein product [Fusarium graminearum]